MKTMRIQVISKFINNRPNCYFTSYRPTDKAKFLLNTYSKAFTADNGKLGESGSFSY